jgi:hypothetical protein
MNDAIALLAISQLVCLGAIFYLYTQLNALKRASIVRRRQPSARIHHMPAATENAPAAFARAAHAAYAGGPPARPAAAGSLAGRFAGTGVDVAALARRMRKSEEEVRLLLRRQGITG